MDRGRQLLDLQTREQVLLWVSEVRFSPEPPQPSSLNRLDPVFGWSGPTLVRKAPSTTAQGWHLEGKGRLPLPPPQQDLSVTVSELESWKISHGTQNVQWEGKTVWGPEKPDDSRCPWGGELGGGWSLQRGQGQGRPTAIPMGSVEGSFVCPGYKWMGQNSTGPKTTHLNLTISYWKGTLHTYSNYKKHLPHFK